MGNSTPFVASWSMTYFRCKLIHLYMIVRSINWYYILYTNLALLPLT